MDELNKVEVVIDGEIITLVSGEKDEYLQKLGRYIDRKLSEIKLSKSSTPISERIRTLLISVNIADDYYKTLDLLEELNYEHEKYLLEISRMQEENQLLNERIRELQDQLNHSRAELEEYIANFDKDNIVNISPRSANGYR